MRNRSLIVFAAIIFLPLKVYLANDGDTTEVQQYLKLGNNKLSSKVLATVGDMKITAQEFMTSYEYGPAFVKRQKDSPRRYLNFMIYEKLLAQEGYIKGVDRSEELNAILSDIEADLATEELYRRNVWNKINITKEQIKSAAEKDKISLSLKWIYRPELKEIEEDYSKIKNGFPFDSLFVKQFSDSIDYEDRYMETNRFELERKNNLLGRIVDSLRPGEISLPIKTPDGAYIVKLESFSKEMITTESEREKISNDVRRALFKDKADRLSDEYVNKIMTEENPVIKREALNMLKAYLGKKILPEEVFNKWDLLKNIRTSHGDFNPADIGPYLEIRLVELKNGGITIKDFIRWYTTRSPYIKLGTKSHQALYLSVQQAVWRMVRDKLLTDIAYKQKLNNLNEVKLQKKWWKDKLVYSQMKLELAGSIKLTEERIKEYYEKNKRRFTDEKGEVKPFDEAKGDASSELLAYEYTRKLVNSVLGRKERVKIKINEELLDQLPIDIKEDPKAIDVYAVKNGGIFMRQAFPVIDYEWQFWN
ncbi:MAG: hypothetical protein ACM34K_00860 [Bacillota bacterium]